MTSPLLLRALRREPVERVPAWVMRQAGRYLPEYRALKEEHGFVGMMTDPELATEVTLQPVRRYPLDAAILFSDILTPFLEAGIGLRFDPGPVMDRPIRSRGQVEALRPYDPDCDSPFLAPAVRSVKRALPPGVALLGFAGSPFTVAAYLVAGRGGDEARTIRRLGAEDPDTLHVLLRKVAETTILHLRQQILAGADAVQVFDTWGGTLSAAQWREWGKPWIRRIVEGIADLGAPCILYLGGAPHLVPDAAATGVAAISVDHRLPLSEARRLAGGSLAVQGNLDPATLFAPTDVIAAETARVLLDAGPRGTIFNLGHGILPETPVEAVATMLAAVRASGGDA